MSTAQATTTPTQTLRERTSYAVLVMISFCHFLDDMIQSLLPAIYPILNDASQVRQNSRQHRTHLLFAH